MYDSMLSKILGFMLHRPQPDSLRDVYVNLGRSASVRNLLDFNQDCAGTIFEKTPASHKGGICGGVNKSLISSEYGAKAIRVQDIPQECRGLSSLYNSSLLMITQGNKLGCRFCSKKKKAFFRETRNCIFVHGGKIYGAGNPLRTC